MLMEAQIVIRPGGKYPTGTILNLMPPGKSYANFAEFEADPLRDPSIEFSRRSGIERMRDDLLGMDTRWGKKDRRDYAIVLVDWPDTFSTAGGVYQIDPTIIPHRLRQKFEDPDVTITVERDTPIVIPPEALILTNSYQEIVRRQQEKDANPPPEDF